MARLLLIDVRDIELELAASEIRSLICRARCRQLKVDKND